MQSVQYDSLLATCLPIHWPSSSFSPPTHYSSLPPFLSPYFPLYLPFMSPPFPLVLTGRLRSLSWKDEMHRAYSRWTSTNDPISSKPASKRSTSWRTKTFGTNSARLRVSWLLYECNERASGFSNPVTNFNPFFLQSYSNNLTFQFQLSHHPSLPLFLFSRSSRSWKHGIERWWRRSEGNILNLCHSLTHSLYTLLSPIFSLTDSLIDWFSLIWGA